MQDHDLQLLIDAALEAGKVATRFSGPTAQVWNKPDGAGPVTEADLAVNQMLEAELRAARPDFGWLSEESADDPDRLNTEHCFIVDPIDGTRSFIEGSSTWAHALAIAKEGVVTAAVVYLPQRDKLYAASLGQGATLNGDPLQVSDRADLTDAHILAARPVMDAANWPRGVPPVQRSHRPSLAYRLSLIAQGRYDAMVTLRPTWEWDIASGDLLIKEAGGVTSDRYGAPLVFNNADPRLPGMIGAASPVHAALTAALGNE